MRGESPMRLRLTSKRSSTASTWADSPVARRKSGAATPCAFAIAASCSVRSRDRKSTRLNSSHVKISYAVFCLRRWQQRSPTIPYTTLFRSAIDHEVEVGVVDEGRVADALAAHVEAVEHRLHVGGFAGGEAEERRRHPLRLRHRRELLGAIA